MRRTNNPLRLMIYVLVGAVLGGILGEILSQIKMLEWIKMGGVNGYRELFSISYDPLLSTNFIKFGFNLTIRVNLGNVIGIIVGLLMYLK